VKTVLLSLIALSWLPGCELLIDDGPPTLVSPSDMGESSPFEASTEGDGGDNGESDPDAGEAQRQGESTSAADATGSAQHEAESTSGVDAMSEACSLDCTLRFAMCGQQCTSAQALCEEGGHANHGAQQKCAKDWATCQNGCVSDCLICTGHGGCAGSRTCGMWMPN
jgi:hypothetical protein